MGPISFRVESRIRLDLLKKQGKLLQNEEHIFALEYFFLTNGINPHNCIFPILSLCKASNNYG